MHQQLDCLVGLGPLLCLVEQRVGLLCLEALRRPHLLPRKVRVLCTQVGWCKVSGADDDDGAVIVNEDDNDDAEPAAPALNENETIAIEVRCKAFIWDVDEKKWSGRGTHVAR